MTSAYWENWRRNRLSRRRVLAGSTMTAAGAASFALVGCGNDDDDDVTPTPANGETPPPTNGEPQTGGVLRQVAGPVGSLLDPHRTNTPLESAGMWHRAGNFLMRFSAEPPHLPEPDLAESQPEVLDDGTRLVFKLHPEAKWQERDPVNGRMVNAEDVKATFERIMAEETTSPRRGNYLNVEGIEAIDEHTVEFRLFRPQADLLAAMGDQYDLIIPAEIAERGPEAIRGPEDVIGSGPYELVAFEAGERIEMRRRPDGYWKPNTAWMDGWEVINIVDMQQRVNALRTGQANYTDLPADLADPFADDPDFYVTSAANPTRECLLINHNVEPYTDPRVRQALQRAVNRQEVYENVFAGGGMVGGPMSPAAAAWTIPDEELMTLPGFRDRNTELTEARQLLDAAGYPDGFEDTILTATAFQVNLTNDVVVSNLAEIGIRLQTENVGTDFAVFLQREIAREYQLCTTLFLSGIYPDAQLYIYHHSTEGSRNYGDYADPEIDRMLEDQRGIFEYEERLPVVLDIQRKLIDEPGPVWIGSRLLIYVVHNSVRNYSATPFLAGYPLAEDAWIQAG
jgi:peptide/nickel transport system substrate-binding protein